MKYYCGHPTCQGQHPDSFDHCSVNKGNTMKNKSLKIFFCALRKEFEINPAVGIHKATSNAVINVIGNVPLTDQKNIISSLQESGLLKEI
jgi:hypothetical protein